MNTTLSIPDQATNDVNVVQLAEAEPTPVPVPAPVGWEPGAFGAGPVEVAMEPDGRANLTMRATTTAPVRKDMTAAAHANNFEVRETALDLLYRSGEFAALLELRKPYRQDPEPAPLASQALNAAPNP